MLYHEDMSHTTWTFTEAVAWQQAYHAAAEREFGIPMGQPVIVTTEQDALLCRLASADFVAKATA